MYSMPIGGKIRILQFNCGSLMANSHEIRSRLMEQRPDIMLIQETNLQREKIINEYVITRKDRILPRNLQEKPRGGGLMILINKERKNLTFEELELTTTDDDTTKQYRARIFIEIKKKIF